MKNTALKLTLIISLFAFFVAPVFAHDGESHDEDSYEETSVMSKEQKMEQLRIEKQERIQKLKEEKQQKLEQLETQREERKMERETAMEEKVAQRCDLVIQRVQDRITNFEENKTSHEEHYNAVISKLTEIATQMEEKGLDTTDLKADVSTMQVMVTEYVATYSNFVAQLNTSLTYDCGESEGAFLDALEGARDTLEVARVLRQEIREFYTLEIRSDIKDLRMQAANLTSEEVVNE